MRPHTAVRHGVSVEDGGFRLILIRAPTWTQALRRGLSAGGYRTVTAPLRHRRVEPPPDEAELVSEEPDAGTGEPVRAGIDVDGSVEAGADGSPEAGAEVPVPDVQAAAAPMK